MADYADIDMDAGFDYEPSIISSDGYAASRDHSPDPRDHATDGVEEGSFSLTTVYATEGPVSSESKGLSNHNQDYTKAEPQHDEGSPSECSSPPKAVRPGEANPRSHHSEASSASSGRLSPVSPTEDEVEHASPASLTIPSQGSPADRGCYNPEFPFLKGLAPSRKIVFFDYSSSEEASSASGDHQREVFVLPSDNDHSPRDRTEDAPRRSHTTTPRGDGEDTSGDERDQHNIVIHGMRRYPKNDMANNLL